MTAGRGRRQVGLTVEVVGGEAQTTTILDIGLSSVRTRKNVRFWRAGFAHPRRTSNKSLEQSKPKHDNAYCPEPSLHGFHLSSNPTVGRVRPFVQPNTPLPWFPFWISGFRSSGILVDPLQLRGRQLVGAPWHHDCSRTTSRPPRSRRWHRPAEPWFPPPPASARGPFRRPHGRCAARSGKPVSVRWNVTEGVVDGRL